jgi:hypothetical protein
MQKKEMLVLAQKLSAQKKIPDIISNGIIFVPISEYMQ